MQKSAAVVIPIERLYQEVYAILSEPRNYPEWSPVADAVFESRGNDGLDWLVDLPRGRRILRFSAPNAYGVLDYTVIEEGESEGWLTPMRLLRNGEGCELVVVFFQRPGVAEERFDSDVEWGRADLMVLKTVIENF